MKKSAFLILINFVAILMVFTACEKEQIQTEDLTALSETKLAKQYLYDFPTLLPLAALTVNHKTHRIEGIFIDKASKVRKIDLNNETYLRFDNLIATEYNLKRWYEASEVIAEIAPEIAVEYVKITSSISANSALNIMEDGPETSKVYLTFNENINAPIHGCGILNYNPNKSFNIIVLSAVGKINYQPTTEDEKKLINWTKSFEAAKEESY